MGNVRKPACEINDGIAQAHNELLSAYHVALAKR